MRLAIPSRLPGGLESPFDGRFESAECFTIVEFEKGVHRRVLAIPNTPCDGGVSLPSVNLLLRSRVRAVVVGEIGILSLAALRMEGIEVCEGLHGTVGAAVREYASGGLFPYQIELKSAAGHCSHHGPPAKPGGRDRAEHSA